MSDYTTPSDTEIVPTGMKIGYGVGDFAHSLAFNLPAFYLIYFYTDVFHLPAAAAGLVVFIAKLWDAGVSPTMGYLVDHTKSRWGNKRPYLLFGPLPVAISIVLLFYCPDIGGSFARTAYALITFMLFCTLMTMITVPYGALTPALTTDSHQRAVLSAYRMVFAVVGTLVGAGATMPLVGLLGAGSVNLGFRRVGFLFGAIVLTIVLITFATVKERIQTEIQRSSFRETLSLIRKNKPFLILAAGVMMYQIAINTMSGVVVYYFKYNLHAEHLVPVAFITMLGTSACSIPLFLYISKKRGKRFAYNFGMGIMAAMSVPLFFFGENNIAVSLVIFVIVGIGVATVYLSPWSMIPDTVEYLEWKTGHRREGMHYGFFQFAFKLSVAIPGAMAGLVLRIVGYVPNEEQTDLALLGIKLLLTFIPLMFVFIGMYLISRYPIDDQFHKRMVSDIALRKASES
ncbi:MAG: MFS transporter [Deltaproteobacteria bacterium]|nr:MFS transporter [Candidatus Zymogenaceae bacterium]